MANEIYTRIQLKYDSYANWKEHNPTLLAGELAVAKLVDDVTIPVDQQKNAPVLFKVGPGKFNDLPWASGLAADVYGWAKKTEAEFKAWVKDLVPVEVIDNGTGKFVTDVTVTNDANGHHITITRADAVNSLQVTDDDVVVLSADKTTGDVTVTGAHAKKGPTGGYAGTQVQKTISSFGESIEITVPKLGVDEYGHTNTAEEVKYTINLPTPEAATNTVTTVEGKEAIGVEDKATNGNHDYEVTLKLDETDHNKTGHVHLTQSDNGLKAEYDLVDGLEEFGIKRTEAVVENGETKANATYHFGKATDTNADLYVPGAVFAQAGFSAPNASISNIITDSISNGESAINIISNINASKDAFFGGEVKKIVSIDGSSTPVDLATVNDVADEIKKVTDAQKLIDDAQDAAIAQALADAKKHADDNEKDTKTAVKASGSYITVDGPATLVENTTNEYTVSINEDALKTLIGEQTTAAMEFKGATAELPAAPAKGDMWKVSGEFDVAGTTAKVGDAIVWNGTEWFLIPSGDDIEDTWRPVKVGENYLESSEALEFIEGDNVTITEEGGKITIASSYVDTTYEADDETLERTETTFKIKDGGVDTLQIADEAVTEAKLEQNVQDALALARTALQEHQSLDGYKKKQEAKTFTGSTVKTVTSVKQNENGEITEVKFEDIGKIANAGHADAADVADIAKKLDTRPTFGVDTGNEAGIVIENESIIFAGAGGGIDYTWSANDVKIGVGSSEGKGRLVVDEHTSEGGIKLTTIEGGTVTTEKLVADAIHLEYDIGGVNPSVDITGNEISVTSGQVVVKDLYNTEAVASLTSNKLTVNEAAIGGVEIKSNETATGAVKYLVFNCGSATVLVD